MDAEAKFSYSIGSKVTIQGIKSKPEYNGLKGTVKSFNEEKGRFLVEIEGGQGFNEVKQLNVLQCNLKSEVTVSSLKTSDLKAILHVFDKQGFTDAHFTEKSELQKLV